MLFELNRPVTLIGAYELLSDRELLEEEMENLESLLETPRRKVFLSPELCCEKAQGRHYHGVTLHQVAIFF